MGQLLRIVAKGRPEALRGPVRPDLTWSAVTPFATLSDGHSRQYSGNQALTGRGCDVIKAV